MNEPRVVATRGYGGGTMPPEIGDPGTTVYTASHNLIKGHAKAYHVYNNEFRKTQKGMLFHVETIPSLLLLHVNLMFIGKKNWKIPTR